MRKLNIPTVMHEKYNHRLLIETFPTGTINEN